MNDFAEVAKAAQVGVRTLAVPLSGHLVGFPNTPSEAAALAELGTLDLMRRAGVEPRRVQPLAPSPEETRRVAPAAHALAEAFALKAEAAVLEWAGGAERAGFVVPPEALPAFLGLPKRSRSRVRPVLGERGLWLARMMNVEVEPPPSETVDLGEWDGLDWKARVEGIGLLAANLSKNDEPILMRALEDRRAEVREAAVELLVRLPDSSATQRLVALARTSVIVRRSLLKTTLDVAPPAPDLLPKWLPRTVARSGVGPGAHALKDVLRFVPPSTWGGSPENLLGLASKTDELEALTTGWGDAALRFDDRDWIDALLRSPHLPPGQNGRFADRASEAAFDAELIPRLERQGDGLMTAYGLLLLRERPFSPTLSRAVVESARRGPGHAFSINDLGTRLDLGVLPMLESPWGEDSAPERLRIHWRTILDLRRRLLESLR